VENDASSLEPDAELLPLIAESLSDSIAMWPSALGTSWELHKRRGCHGIRTPPAIEVS
jgi:hypothetical protein